MKDCDRTMTWLCDDGTVCSVTSTTDPIRPAELGSCNTGGAINVGESCIGHHLECTAGNVCVIFEETVRETCQRACSTDDPSGCASGEACMAFAADTTSGFCHTAI
jgi:hypothetical protein